MFTGIVTDIGTVRAVRDRGDRRLRVACGYDMAGVDLGASIACSGVCLTVVAKGDDWFEVDLSAESAARTAPLRWEEGARLNLERALRLGDELGGHLVTGHVDAVGEVAEVVPVGDSREIAIRAPAPLAPFLVEKGSITVDGVSLTVNVVRDDGQWATFSVNVIPHTADHTTLGSLVAGDAVNLEIDVIARYLKRMADLRM